MNREFKPIINEEYLSLRTYHDSTYFFEYDKNHVIDIIPKYRVAGRFIIQTDIIVECDKKGNVEGNELSVSVTVFNEDTEENIELKETYVVDNATALKFKEELISEGLI